MTPTPVVIDVDTGIDDAFALLHALAAPTLRVVGVSTVAGNVSLAKATRNTRAVLALAGADSVPVWPGCAAPLVYPQEDASIVHGATGLGYAVLPEPAEDRSALHAVDAILAAAKAHEGELVLAPTGPLTNVAAAVTRDPDLVKRLKRCVIMGGAFRVPGNVTPTAEFNIWHDPEAARIVFRAFGQPGAAPLVAIGLDVTHEVKLVPEDLQSLAARCDGGGRAEPLMRFLEDSARYYFELMRKWRGSSVLFMHDPLAIGVAADPTLVTTERLSVDVETNGRLTRGMTVVDPRGQWGTAPNVDVAVKVDAARYLEAFGDAIATLATR